MREQCVVVLAGNAREAEEWRRSQGLKRQEFIYAGSPRSLDGVCPTRVVQLSGFIFHRYSEQLELMVLRIMQKSKDPIKIEHVPHDY